MLPKAGTNISHQLAAVLSWRHHAVRVEDEEYLVLEVVALNVVALKALGSTIIITSLILFRRLETRRRGNVWARN